MFTPIGIEEVKNLPIYVVGSKSILHQKHEKYPSGFAISSQLSIFTEGSGIFVDHNKNKHRVAAGDVFYFLDGTPVEYYPLTQNWSSKYIVCGGSYLAKLMEYLGFSMSGVISTKRNNLYNDVNLMFENIIKQNEIPGKLSSADLSLMLYELLLSLSKCIGSTDSSKLKLLPIIKAINERYAEDLSLDELAEIAGYNPTYTEKLFRSIYNTSPINYLIRIRIENAQKLLCSNLSMTVKEVGESCGFKDNSYFGKIFKKFTGLTPREYRAANTYVEN
ncbi:MAG: AraC family transcriptional regulator [Clostridia bacterium]